MQYLPGMPDAAILTTMAWYAAVGSTLGVGGWLFGRIADRGARFGAAAQADYSEVEVPGFKAPGEDERKRASPAGAVRLALGGGVAGALLAWVIESPESIDERLQLGMELLAVAVAVFVLVRTMRQMPALGEAPPDDPAESAPARVRNAVFNVLGACFMLGMVWVAGEHSDGTWIIGGIALGALGLLLAWWSWLNDPESDPAVLKLPDAEVPREAMTGFAAAIGVVVLMVASFFWFF